MNGRADIQLAPNFRLREFLVNEDTFPDGEVLQNLYCLANRLQAIRDLLGKPVMITSGYRSPEHNQRVGGALHSYHTRGMAADIEVPGMSPQAVQAFLANWSGGLGGYTTHTHVDIRPYKARWGTVVKQNL